MPDRKTEMLFSFMEETVRYFLDKAGDVDRDRYFADRDRRYILDKSINDIILCMVDLSEECLKKHMKAIPDTYRDTILACYDFAGDTALKVAPLVKLRNESVHQYLKINWQNIVTIKTKIDDINQYVAVLKKAFA